MKTIDSKEAWELAQKHGLTRKQYLYVEHKIINGGNQTQAAIDAGYKKENAASQGARLSNNAKIVAYTRERLGEVDKTLIMDSNEVLMMLTSVARGEYREEQALSTQDGVKIVDIKSSIKDRTRAAELMGKHHKLFTDKKEVEQETKVIINSEYVSNDK